MNRWMFGTRHNIIYILQVDMLMNSMKLVGRHDLAMDLDKRNKEYANEKRDKAKRMLLLCYIPSCNLKGQSHIHVHGHVLCRSAPF